MKLEFTKMEGLGNDFVVIDNREKTIENYKEISAKLCNRRFGIGADGVLFVEKSKDADIEMIIYNADGSYAAMCGNGIRCFAKYVYEKGMVEKNPITIETGDGIKEAFLTIENNKVIAVTINMGKESFEPKDIPLNSSTALIDEEREIKGRKYKLTSLLMGVPHTVVFEDLSNFPVSLGKDIEKFTLYPEGTNVNFCEVKDKDYIVVKTWERGAGETLACGTGCCSSVIVANKLGLLNKKSKVEAPGGFMEVEIKEDGVFMTGPANIVFEGLCEI